MRMFCTESTKKRTFIARVAVSFGVPQHADFFQLFFWRCINSQEGRGIGGGNCIFSNGGGSFAEMISFRKRLNENLFSFYSQMNDTFTFRLLYFARTKEKYKQSGRNTI